MVRVFCIILVLNFVALGVNAQKRISGIIKSAESQKPVPYATIQVNNSNRGTIANEEGFFRLQADFQKSDSITISMLSFHSKTISYKGLSDSVSIYLDLKSYALDEVTIRAWDEKIIFAELADILKIYRKSNESVSSKAYFRLFTLLDQRPVEFVEGLYNVRGTVGSGPTKLALKMGRFGQSKTHKFYNLNTTNQLTSLQLFIKGGGGLFPKWCGNLNLSKLAKSYKIVDYIPYDKAATVKLKSKTEELFDVEIEVDLERNLIKTINLKTHHARLPGYVPLDKSDSLDFKMVELLITYYPDSKRIQFITMDQEINYFHEKGEVLTYKTKADLLMTDYTNLFIDPVDFSDVSLSDDYSKMVAYGFDADFWASNNTITFSNSLTNNLQDLMRDGDAVFFNSKEVSKEVLQAIEYPLLKLDSNSTITWADFGMNSDEINLDKTFQKRIEVGYARSNLYNLEFNYVVNPLKIRDRFIISSSLFFDKSRSFFYLDKEDALLLSIDSIRKEIFEAGVEFNKNATGENLNGLADLVDGLNGKTKKLSRQVYILAPIFEKSLATATQDSSVVYYNLALAFQRSDNYTDALRNYERSMAFCSLDSVDKKPVLMDIYYNRSIIYEKLGQTDKACNELQKGSSLGDLECEKRRSILCEKN